MKKTSACNLNIHKSITAIERKNFLNINWLNTLRSWSQYGFWSQIIKKMWQRGFLCSKYVWNSWQNNNLIYLHNGLLLSSTTISRVLSRFIHVIKIQHEWRNTRYACATRTWPIVFYADYLSVELSIWITLSIILSTSCIDKQLYLNAAPIWLDWIMKWFTNRTVRWLSMFLRVGLIVLMNKYNIHLFLFLVN